MLTEKTDMNYYAHIETTKSEENSMPSTTSIHRPDSICYSVFRKTEDCEPFAALTVTSGESEVNIMRASPAILRQLASAALKAAVELEEVLSNDR